MTEPMSDEWLAQIKKVMHDFGGDSVPAWVAEQLIAEVERLRGELEKAKGFIASVYGEGPAKPAPKPTTPPPENEGMAIRR